MDGDRFDSLTRALGAGRSRRSVLRGLGAAALGAVGLGRLGSAGAARICRVPGQLCRVDGDCCSARCLPDAARSSRCGAPVCGGHPANYCDGACTDVATDLANCGSCGTVCPGDACNTATCNAGVCGTTPVTGGACTATGGTAGTCQNGTCVANPVGCTGGSACSDGGPTECNGNPLCSCAATVAGTTACFQWNGFGTGGSCSTAAPCPSGEACIAATCNGDICQPLCASGGASIRSAAVLSTGPNTP